MIILVPTSPEVPAHHIPRLWPALTLILLLSIAFLLTYDTLEADNQFVEGAFEILAPHGDWSVVTDEQIISMFSKRPLLQIAPCRSDWDVTRVMLANFVHGGKMHLLLNLIGVFAGARICAAFLPVFGVFMVFLLGGSVGIWGSMILSTEGLGYVPHVGASGGIFSLMGAYYAFNFSYRTRYFFWFPTRKGTVALPTSWAFFLDFILLELVLSAAQMFPTRIDNVDHLAHVIGFAVGILLALSIRLVRRWPHFIHTRAELLHWKTLERFKLDDLKAQFETWLRCLTINPFNDLIKFKLFDLLLKKSEAFSDTDLERACQSISPTFVRRNPLKVAQLIKKLLIKNRKLPQTWLASIPYDVVIHIARSMASPADEQYLLYQFVDAYRQALPENSGFNHKLELLVRRLGGIMQPTPGGSSGYSPGNSPEDSSPRPSNKDSKSETAKKVS